MLGSRLREGEGVGRVRGEQGRLAFVCLYVCVCVREGGRSNSWFTDSAVVRNSHKPVTDDRASAVKQLVASLLPQIIIDLIHTILIELLSLRCH